MISRETPLRFLFVIIVFTDPKEGAHNILTSVYYSLCKISNIFESVSVTLHRMSTFIRNLIQQKKIYTYIRQ